MNDMSTTQEAIVEEYRKRKPCLDTQCDGDGTTLSINRSTGEPQQEQCEYCYKERFPDIDWLRTTLTHIAEVAKREERERKIEEYGFYDLVAIAKQMLKTVYPLDVFDGSSGDAGPLFTSRLHHALDALPASNEKEV